MERVFGILKGRWRCLKNPILFQSVDKIDNMFMACCILHNMLLDVDGGEALPVAEEIPDEEDAEFLERANRYARMIDRTQVGYRWNFLPDPGPNGETNDEVNRFTLRRNKLACHFHYLYTNHRNRIKWR